MINYGQYDLWERELIFREQCKGVPKCQYAVVWEDPKDPDASAKVTRPNPMWLAMAMHGGILPPVEVYWVIEGDGDTVSPISRFLLHKAPPVGPMTEEQAMEYLIKKDIPKRVWRDYKGNRQILKIVPVSYVPSDRSDRDIWCIEQEAA